ncbi:TIGR02186 family protein [Roseibium sp.]|uniref:TIGR02186 family protein n=1 Tax=Roseibium sp. TaxID=1936156 RepID=UPI003A9801C2
MIRHMPLVGLTLLTLVTGLFAQPARSEDLVTALSSDMVSIQSNFTGTEIVIFGQIARDVNTIARPGQYDLVITVEGPSQDITTRRKGRFLGVWVNREYETFQQVPSFYALASTQSVGNLGSWELLDEHGIGLNHLNLAISGRSGVPLSERDDFRQAFLRLRQEQGLYSERPGGIEFLTETMFRTTVPLPANIPVGSYTVKSYLFQDQGLLSRREAELEVAKIGFEQFTYKLAHDFSAIYGLIAVVLAIFTGWLAGVIFRKD